MRKLIFLLLLLLIATPCFAQQQEARMSLGVVGGKVPVVVAGAWHYPGRVEECVAAATPWNCCTGSGTGTCIELTDTSWTSTDTWGDGWSVGSWITLPANTTAKKLAAYFNDAGTPIAFKVAIRNAATNAVLASATGASSGVSGIRWHEVTFTTPYSVGVSDLFVEARFYFAPPATPTFGYLSSDKSGNNVNEAYTSFPSATASSTDSYWFAVKVWVE